MYERYSLLQKCDIETFFLKKEMGKREWGGGGYSQSVFKRIPLAGVPDGTIERAGYGQYFTHYFHTNHIYSQDRIESIFHQLFSSQPYLSGG
jgi:hypothetical protein